MCLGDGCILFGTRLNLSYCTEFCHLVQHNCLHFATGQFRRPTLLHSLPYVEEMPQPYEFKKLGFIGLGAMGVPMLSNLAKKLPEDSRIWVYDVVEQTVDDVCAEFPSKVLKGRSAKDVAQQAVCCT
jgi:hypothetical protein